MLGVAIDAAAGRLVESVGEARQHRAAEAGRRPRREQHGGGRVGMRLAHRLMLAGVAADARRVSDRDEGRSEEHTSELQSLMRNSYAVFCLKKKPQRQ